MTDDTPAAALAAAAAGTPASLDDLRRAFDRSFALPPRGDDGAMEEFVAIRLGSDRYALAIRDIASLEPLRKLVPLPASRPALLGLAGIRGRLVPVFGLALLLGQPDRKTASPWLALVGRDDPLGFAFDGVDGHLRNPRQAMEAPGTAGEQFYIRQILRRNDEPPRLVVDVPRLVAALRAPAQTHTT